jgi:hypothetical protein
MRTRSHLLATSAAVALTGVGPAAPGTALGIPDSKSADAVDAAPAAAAAPYRVDDARSPDAVDAATAGSPAVDRRSPDAVDAAAAATPAPAQSYKPVTPSTASVQTSAGFDWDSAAIGAGGAIGLLAVSVGTGLALRRRHSHHAPGGIVTH